jgi:hypothetical protein
MCENVEEKNFADVSEVFSYLVSEGWRVSISTFYRHQSQGKVRAQPDGTYTLRSVQKYSKTFLHRRDTTALLKAALERELTERLAAFKNDIETFCRNRAAEIVALVSGDPRMVPDLIEYLLDHAEDCIERDAK